MQNHYSRPMKSAEGLNNLAPDRHRFLEKRVILTGGGAYLHTRDGRICLLASLRLLLRICKNVLVQLPTGSEDLALECDKVLLSMGSAPSKIGKFSCDGIDAILVIGESDLHEGPVTIASNNGWIANISTSPQSPEASHQDNPIVAFAAAALGVTEIFKRLVNLKPERGQIITDLHFDFFKYEIANGSLGPIIPSSIELDALLGGVGAIGNGCIYLLNLLPVTGRLLVVDNQTFGSENIGTCLLAEPSMVGVSKARFAENYLSHKILCKGFREPISVFSQRLGKEFPFPKVILGALDNIDARYELQEIWPALVIDGAIGVFASQVSRHPFGADDIACVRCLFKNGHRDADVVASHASGIDTSRIRELNGVVNQDDINRAPTAKRDWLALNVGKPICSVVQEAMAQSISNSNIEFQPSVPFVANLSAAMMVTELVKFTMGLESNLEPRFQFDVLRGPAVGQLLPQSPDPRCICRTRFKNIEAWRESRIL